MLVLFFEALVWLVPHETAAFSSVRTVAGWNKLEDTVVTADAVTAFSSAVGRVLQGAATHTKAVRAKMCFSQFLNRACKMTNCTDYSF